MFGVVERNMTLQKERLQLMNFITSYFKAFINQFLHQEIS